MEGWSAGGLDSWIDGWMDGWSERASWLEEMLVSVFIFFGFSVAWAIRHPTSDRKSTDGAEKRRFTEGNEGNEEG